MAPDPHLKPSEIFEDEMLIAYISYTDSLSFWLKRWKILGSCVFCAPLDRHIGRHIDRYSTDMAVDVSTDTRPTCRSTYRPILYRHVGRHIGRYVDRHISVDISAECRSIRRPTYRPSVGRYVDRHVGRVSVDMSTDMSVEGCTKYTWSKFSLGNLPGEKSVTLLNLSFPR